MSDQPLSDMAAPTRAASDKTPDLPHLVAAREAEAAVIQACGGKVSTTAVQQFAAQPDEPGHVTAGREAEAAVASAGPI